MTADWSPAEVFSLAETLSDEMLERGWKSSDVAARMATGRDPRIDQLCVEFVLACPDEDGLIIDAETFDGLARAFDVNAAFFRNIDAMWRKWPDRRSRFEAPEHLFDGASLATKATAENGDNT